MSPSTGGVANASGFRYTDVGLSRGQQEEGTERAGTHSSCCGAVGSPPGPVNLTRAVMRPERLYLATLALSGAATLVSVALPPAQRGILAACIASATMGSAIGGFSIDTFILSRPGGWVLGRGRRWIVGLIAACVALSAAVAAIFTAIAGVGSYTVAPLAASALTVFNALSALALRLQKFRFVYSMRAIASLILISMYLYLYVTRNLDGRHWSIVWLAAQSFAAVAVAVGVLRLARGFGEGDTPETVPAVIPADGHRSDLGRMTKLHVGVCAQMFTYRFDQILLARFAGAGPLGVYALAVAAMEFAQAGAVVGAQRILATRERQRGVPKVLPVLRTGVPIALLSVTGLAAMGAVLPHYHEAWLAGLLLLPGSLAVIAGKTWSAGLLKQRGEQATAVVALATLAVAVPAYLLLVPWFGMIGAAVASSAAYLVYALGSRVGLRTAPRALAGEMA